MSFEELKTKNPLVIENLLNKIQEINKKLETTLITKKTSHEEIIEFMANILFILTSMIDLINSLNKFCMSKNEVMKAQDELVKMQSKLLLTLSENVDKISKKFNND